MYGIFHVELQHYIESRHGHDTWAAILQRTGLKNRIYMTLSTYLDSEITTIIDAAADLTGMPRQALFEDFGAFVVPALMYTYEPLINPKWGMMELLLNLEEAVYRVIRTRSPGAQPPRMKAHRLGPRRLRLHYPAPHRMPALAIGFVKGLASYYGETIALQPQELPDGSLDIDIQFAPEDGA